MEISEIDLLRAFIEEKNLSNQYQEWRQSYVKDYENVVVKFHCLNGKYEFEITIARKQLPYFIEWSKEIEPDYPFKSRLEIEWENGKAVYERWSEVFLTGNDVKTIFSAINHSKGENGLITITNGSVEWEWTESDCGVISEFTSVSDYQDDDSETCGIDFVQECQDWAYTTKEKDPNYDDAYIWNIEDK
jgi:hypothetical protein